MASAGAVLGERYVLGRRIGNGGFGEVWHGTDTRLRRLVAVKLLHPRYADRGEALARFQAEARLAGSISHKNIAQVYDYGEQAGEQMPYLVMELVDGPSLEAALADGPLASHLVMGIVAQTAAGLRAAHAAGMIHRDVKPANLLLAPDGTVKITDFGIAHTIGTAPVTATGEMIGTPGYLAPERVEGASATPASDLYSLGIVAYECLAGARPFTGPPLVVALAHRDRPLPPLPPSVPDGVTALVMRLTAKDPMHRPNGAAEVVAWAGLLRDGLGTGLAPPGRVPLGTVPPRPRPGARPEPPGGVGLRRSAALACGFIALMALTVIVLSSVTGFAPAPRSARTASSSGVSRSVSSHDRRSVSPLHRPNGPRTRPAVYPAMSPVARRPRPSTAPAVTVVHPGHGKHPGPRQQRPSRRTPPVRVLYLPNERGTPGSPPALALGR